MGSRFRQAKVAGTPTESSDRAEGEALLRPARGEKRLIGGNDGSDRLASGDVRDDGARAGVEDRGEHHRQDRDNQHRLLEADGAKGFCDIGKACLRSGAMSKKIAEAAGEHGSDEAPHMYMAMK